MRAPLPLLLALALLACGGEEEGPKPKIDPITAERLVGSWTGPNPSMGGKAKLTCLFEASGSVTVTTTAVGGVAMTLPPSTGNWETDGTRLKIDAGGVWKRGWMSARFEGSELVLDDKYHFKRDNR